jgi:hypothetical protein
MSFEILVEELFVKSPFLSQKGKKGIPLGFVEFLSLFALNASQRINIPVVCVSLITKKYTPRE